MSSGAAPAKERPSDFRASNGCHLLEFVPGASAHARIARSDVWPNPFGGQVVRGTTPSTGDKGLVVESTAGQTRLESGPDADLAERLRREALDLLDYARVRDAVAGQTRFLPARRLALIMAPSYDESEVAGLQAETSERLRVLDEVGWNKKQASEILEISRGTLYRKIVEFDLQPDAHVKGARGRARGAATG